MYNSLSDLIFSTIYQDVIGNETSPYNQMKKKLYAIDTDYFEKIPADTEKLHRDLNPSLRDQVVEDFRKMADFYLGPSYQSYLLESIHRMIEAYFPNATPQSITEACDKAKNELLSRSKTQWEKMMKYHLLPAKEQDIPIYITICSSYK